MLLSDQQARGISGAGLRSKFIAAFALQTLVVAILILIVQQWLVRRAMVGQIIEQGRAIARTVEATAPYYVIFGLTSDLTNIVRDLKRNESIEYADFLDSDGKTLARSG